MVSAVITAAGKNSRMIEDLKSRGLPIDHKLLLPLRGKPVIARTIENVLNSGVDLCYIVLGHFSDDIATVLNDYCDERINVVINPDFNVELSETLLNGVKNVKPDLCLCVAADQPTVTSHTLKTLVEKAVNYENPENIVSIMARGNTGLLESAEGLGMPFICHSKLLLKYLPGHRDNLNPILREMISDGVVFFGVKPENSEELININRYDDYLRVKNCF